MMARASTRTTLWPPYQPQFARLVRRAPSGPAWLHELIHEGRRIGCVVGGKDVIAFDRRGRDCTSDFPELASAARALRVRRTVIDGQMAVVLPGGSTSLPALERALSGGRREGLTYFVFDLLSLNGRDMTGLALVERKAELRRLLRRAPSDSFLRYSEHFEGDGALVLEKACELGAQGIVSKRRDLPYAPGRTSSWRKTKCGERRPIAGGGVAVTRGSRDGLRRRAAKHSIVVRGVTITTPGRMVYPSLRFTKLDLARLYDEMGEVMLPHVRGRPLTLVRCERGVTRDDGLRPECAFLRHTEGWHRWAPACLRRVHIREQKKTGEYLVVDSPEGLIGLAQGDILEIHVWNTTTEHVEMPDQVVFDLDPGAAVPWSTVVQAAHELRQRLSLLGLESWPRLTGGKGIHVVAPLEPKLGWDQIYGFTRLLAEAMERDAPHLFTTTFSRDTRSAKILVDYKRNHRAATAIASYSPRARPNGAMATPIAWLELSPALRPDAFTVATLPARLRSRRTDPWNAFWRCRQQLGRLPPKL